MDKLHVDHSKFAEGLDRLEGLQYNLCRIQKQVGLEGLNEFQEALQKVEDFYQSTISDLIFEARGDDPAHGVNTKWLKGLVRDCEISMGDNDD